MKLTLTVPPYAHFKDIVTHPTVEAVRLNTTLPVHDSLDTILSNIKAQADPKDVWIDLKCRQLRIQDYNVNITNEKETHYITLSHNITLNTPSEMFVDDGNYVGKINSVQNGNQIVVESSTENRYGLPLPSQGEVGIRPGMSINILDPSLKIDGYLTQKDKDYIDAAKKVGMHNYLLSYVEQKSDIEDILKLDPDAQIIAKIESKKGLDFVKKVYPKYKGNVHLMAARGDLYVELDKPDEIITACEHIINADPEAVLASRLFESLKNPNQMPKSQDIFDVYCGMRMGYKRFMIGDDVCLKKESVESAIGLFDTIVQNGTKYKETVKKRLRSVFDIIWGK